MKKILAKFRKDEIGAVTVDWVVLTAAIVALALGAITLIRTSVSTQASIIASNVDRANG
ncbi:MAG: hypothetical protein AAF429_08995 [Pseudomonadota bacterium]